MKELQAVNRLVTDNLADGERSVPSSETTLRSSKRISVRSDQRSRKWSESISSKEQTTHPVNEIRPNMNANANLTKDYKIHTKKDTWIWVCSMADKITIAETKYTKHWAVWFFVP